MTAPSLPASKVTRASCTVLLSEQQIHIPPTAFTFEGFRAWTRSDHFPERGRISFIDQEIVLDMTGEEYEAHGQVKAEVSRQILNLIDEEDLGKFFPDGTLITNEATGISNIPDGAFAGWETFATGRVRLVPREGETDQFVELEGTPDWILEVVSDSSVRKDTQQLLQAYHRAGIPEYWLIDARGAEIDFQILWHQPQGYTAAPRRGRWQRARVFRRRFRLVRRRDRIGLWHYQLQIKPV